MIKYIGVLVVLMFATTVAEAAPRRVLVLPLDGNAEPALRGKLNLAIQKVARKSSANVSVGDTTFSETAAAVGCDPASPECAETVRSTLGVDELVWGTATWTNGQTNLVVRRTVAKAPMRSATVLLGPQDSSEKADTSLAPLFGGEATATEPSEPAITAPVGPEAPPFDNRKRTTGIIITSAGGVVLLIGLALWSNKSSVQRDIDAAPTDDAADFERLEELESRAFKYAMTGNVMVLAGLGVAAYGGWMIYQDRTERRVAVTPQITPTTATVTVGGTW